MFKLQIKEAMSKFMTWNHNLSFSIQSLTQFGSKSLKARRSQIELGKERSCKKGRAYCDYNDNVDKVAKRKSTNQLLPNDNIK